MVENERVIVAVRSAAARDLRGADLVACRAYAEYEKDFPEWVPFAVLRFMAVDPGHRRQGVPLYLKMGFARERPMAPVMGMPAEVLALRLAPSGRPRA
jgi:hypothetical protein